MENASQWNIDKSDELYSLSRWGAPYFSINASGHMVVSPQGERGGSIDLFDLIEALKKRNFSLPILIRFPDILRDRIDRLNAAFAKAIARYSYRGCYRGVFPIKVNHQRHLIEAITQFGEAYRYGLEACSKPELLVAIATLKTPGAFIVCNGYKDYEYIETAMLAQQLGKTVFIVLEQLDEVKMAIAIAKKLKLKPRFGFRVKLTKKGQGHWGSSVGKRAKYGLSITELDESIELLQENQMLDSLQLLHYHVGSQISSISVIKTALREAGKIYANLVKLGAPMGYLDVGGGLAVDYDGSKSNFYASKNYNMQNYANDVVAEISDACSAAAIPVPTLISESGRAASSHQDVLICDVLGCSSVGTALPSPARENEPYVLKTLRDIYEGVNAENCQESYHDAEQFKEEADSAFQMGLIGIKDRAQADNLYWGTCRKVQTYVEQMQNIPDDMETLQRILSHIYYVNMSVFQSCADSWAIKQLFPIMPIHRLNEEPSEKATLADLTCDSDGKIDTFIDIKEDTKPLLEVHKLLPPEQETARIYRGHHQPYYLGLFLCGAYQGIMGNKHNLFGSVNTVYVNLTPQGYMIRHVIPGESMADVLKCVQYSSSDMMENIRQQCETALGNGEITLDDSQLLQSNFSQSLSKYTYMNE